MRKSSSEPNKYRVAFFADIHFQGIDLGVQTDVGAPSKYIPKQAQKVLNQIEPDVIFCLGDLTAVSAPEDWQGYQQWLSGIEAPVYEIFGNHDRDYTVFNKDHYGQEFYTVLGRLADTKALRIGNQIFILVSEEHNPEGDENLLTSTIPEKRFQFIERILKKYSNKNNIFILSHTLLRGTTALSNDWSFNDINDWQYISEKMMTLFDHYPVVGHLTGHTHLDYRYRSWVKKLDGSRRETKVGKFINGNDYQALPNVYFLNMPCVDSAHGWFGSNFAILRELGKSTAKTPRSPVRKWYMKYEEQGPALFDMFYKTIWGRFIGRSAIYYIDFIEGSNEIKVITRWLAGNKNVEEYMVKLNQPVDLKSSMVELVESDLSIESKRNLNISRDDWFTLLPNQQGWVKLSQSFPELTAPKKVEVSAFNLKNYSIEAKGSRDKGKTWSTWVDNLAELGKINSVKLKVNLEAGDKLVRIRDIQIK